ncbi:flavodoxin family protein [Chloroflexota bacterium]
MKILGILCSPRKNGNTAILMREALTSAKDCGAETEIITIGDKDVKPCDGCYSCIKTGKCHIEDDMQDIYPKLLAADGIIWGTPVYFFDATAQAKIIIDRLYVLYADNRLTNKVGGVIAVASSLGHAGVWHLFNAFFSVHHMLSADFVSGFAREKGDIRKDQHAMKAAGELGRQVVLIAEKQFKYPERYDLPIYRFVKREYGIDQSPAMGRFIE